MTNASDETLADPTVAARLELLRKEWDYAYVIWFQAGQFHAMRRDNAASCKRLSAEELRREMNVDYRQHPVWLA